MNKERFGNYIKARRIELGLSRKDVIEDSGGLFKADAYKSWELGLYVPEMEKVFKLADILEVDYPVLFAELEAPLPVEIKSNKSITLPDNFPRSAKTQLETFVKFIQYQKEFEVFLQLYDTYQGERPTREQMREKLSDYLDQIYPDRGTKDQAS